MATPSQSVSGGRSRTAWALAEVLALLAEMDVDAAAWIPAMRTPKDRLYVYTREELAEYGWVADGQVAAAEGASGEAFN